MSDQAAVLIELQIVVLVTGAQIEGLAHEDLLELVFFDLSTDGLDGKGALASGWDSLQAEVECPVGMAERTVG